jgi:hypothetical protein
VPIASQTRIQKKKKRMNEKRTFCPMYFSESLAVFGTIKQRAFIKIRDNNKAQSTELLYYAYISNRYYCKDDR